ncbi:putative bifunctional inhibitor/plant lipid transfer protein/seed storage helical [Helianthus anomalus]
MAKLALFALTFTALIAFSVVSAYRTTITTTIEDNHMIALWDGLDNPEEQCRSHITTLQLNHCQMHLTQDITFDKTARRPCQKEQQHLQQCCSELKEVNPQCQCDAIQQVLTQAR